MVYGLLWCLVGNFGDTILNYRLTCPRIRPNIRRMARIARVVAPGIPHHVTQRGNRRQPVFFDDADYQTYLSLLAEWCKASGVEVWAYCLMTNHVHLLLVPHDETGMHKAIGETHRRYTRMINFRSANSGDTILIPAY